MSAEQLGAYAGIVLSLALFYIPGLSDWYNGLTPQKQAGIMALLLFAVAASVYGLACVNWYNAVTCDTEGLKQIINVFIAALIANQSVYLIAVRPVKKARALK